MRKILSLMLAAVLALAAIPAMADDYTVRDAYLYFAQNDGQFVLKTLDTGYEDGVTESVVLSFLNALQRAFYIENLTNPITEDNFQEVFFEKLKQVSNADRFAGLQSALTDAFPAAADYAARNRVHPDYQSLFDIVRSMMLEHRMMDWFDSDPDLTFELQAAKAEDVTVNQLETPALPDRVRCLSESGLWVEQPVSWNELPDTAYAGPTSVRGRVALAEGYVKGEGFDGTVSLRLTVQPLDEGGNFGSGLSWSLKDGVLTVSGSCRIPDFAEPDAAPWAPFRDAVNKIVIESGITTVGQNAFAGIKNLASRSVELPQTVTSVRTNAFAGTGLDSAVLPSGNTLSSVYSGAFDGGVTLYGGKVGGKADKYASENGLTFIPDNWTEPEIIDLEPVRNDGETKVEVNVLNLEDSQLMLVTYGSGMEMLDTVTVSGGEAQIDDQDTKYVKVFCWDTETLQPLCKARSLRLGA